MTDQRYARGQFLLVIRPTRPMAGYLAPLHKWDVTGILGITLEPILLGRHSFQTYRPGHHNFIEESILEPRLTEGIDPGVVSEL